jgi:hypothetical protein
MLRVLLALLVLANVLFFFWARGWLGAAWPPPGQSQREPERLAAQVRPERLVLLGPDAARSATSAARSAAAPPPAAPSAAPSTASAAAADAPAATLCLEAGPYTAAQLAVASRNLVARLGLEAGTWAEAPAPTPVWLVFAGRFADTAARRTRVQAWQRQGVPAPDNLDAPRELSPGLVFSRHTSRGDADAALAALAQRHPPVASVARVVQATGAAASLSMLRLAAADTALAQRLREANLPTQDRFTRCATP